MEKSHCSARAGLKREKPLHSWQCRSIHLSGGDRPRGRKGRTLEPPHNGRINEERNHRQICEGEGFNLLQRKKYDVHANTSHVRCSSHTLEEMG